MYDQIDFDNKRTNIDSSKKIACMQHMDYDGFRQMVLGANLKPIKAGQIPGMYKGKALEGNINHVATYNHIIGNEGEDDTGYNQDVVKATLELTQADGEMSAPESLPVFEKILCKRFKDPFKRYIYLRLTDFTHYESIFNKTFDAEVFLVVVDTILDQVISKDSFNTKEEHIFVAKFLTLITKTPQFDFLLDFMEDTERNKIKMIIKGMSTIQKEPEY